MNPEFEEKYRIGWVSSNIRTSSDRSMIVSNKYKNVDRSMIVSNKYKNVDVKCSV